LEDRNLENQYKIIEKERKTTINTLNREIKRLEYDLEARQDSLRALYNQEKLKAINEFPYKFIYKNLSYADQLDELGLVEKKKIKQQQQRQQEDAQPEQQRRKPSSSSSSSSNRVQEDVNLKDYTDSEEMINLNRAKKIQSAHARLSTDSGDFKRSNSIRSTSALETYKKSSLTEDDIQLRAAGAGSTTTTTVITEIKQSRLSLDEKKIAAHLLRTLPDDDDEEVVLPRITASMSVESNLTEAASREEMRMFNEMNESSASSISLPKIATVESNESLEKVVVDANDMEDEEEQQLSNLVQKSNSTRSTGLELRTFSKASRDADVKVKTSEIKNVVNRQNERPKKACNGQKPLRKTNSSN
jgi:hypothetical protein